MAVAAGSSMADRVAAPCVCACIDIGSNTTRLLVAERRGRRAARGPASSARSRASGGAAADGAIAAPRRSPRSPRSSPRRCALRRAARRRAHARVGTAAIREARQPRRAVRRGRARAPASTVDVLDGEEEARLAFARRDAHARPRRSTGSVAVVDVGGGSTEIAIGTVGGGVDWSESLPIGSGVAGRRATCTRDPPSAARAATRCAQHVAGVFEGLELPAVDARVAVGGSATSLRAAGRRRCSTTRRCERGVRAARARRRRRGRARASTSTPSACGCCPPGSLVLDAAARRARPRRCRSPAAACARASSSSSSPARLATRHGQGRRRSALDRRRAVREAAARIVARARARSSSSTPRACSTRPTSSASTTCASPPGGCAPCSRSSRRASRKADSAVLRDVKALADALGERRDPDVQLEALRGASAASSRSSTQLRERQAAGNDAAAAAQRGGNDALARDAAEAARPARPRSSALPRSGRGVKARKVKGLDPTGRSPTTPSASCRAPGRAVLVRAAGARTRARSRRCTTCASPPSACATSSRSPRPCFGPYAEDGGQARSRSCRTCSARSTTATSSCPRCARCSTSCAPPTPTALLERAGDADRDRESLRRPASG